MGMESSAESPQPVRVVMQAVGGWIGRLGKIWVEGQVAEMNRRGGTVFMTLRDPVANVSARVVCPARVLEAVAPVPEAGARVVVHAKPDFYVARGTFSLLALEVRHVGLGELLARLEQLRATLAAEGLFSEARKRPLPFLPGTVGLICGRQSAAERDVLENGRRRWPAVRFEVREVAVQGDRAVGEVMNALKELDAHPDVDVIIIARGGGSLEDLLPFSDEALVRAVSATRTPVVSAIGHEQDSPLLDLVADVRASTPTDAAKKTVPDVGEQLQLIRQLRDRGRRVLRGGIDRERAWLAGMRSRPVLASPLREIDRLTEQVTGLRDRARRCMGAALDRAGDNLTHTRARLHALSPATTLARGYAIVQRADGAVVRSAGDVAEGDPLRVRFTEDSIRVTVDAVGLPGAPAGGPPDGGPASAGADSDRAASDDRATPDRPTPDGPAAGGPAPEAS
ncbi:exodeoxyribonuclease VII large subunit [Streptomonospora nanhaiensis]|uniref:Exodeoxyribonuclease 7 large subunit n=1 Tax=Streptomonospora nanhaiensis TaxID=1323731 RepID=A0A853BU58_9ACTN|nr:exodeoxyribonuclease VII large subunit [Streptomonospora nanhaiensis]MBX9387017.1 exodeoxyribonuclease VII large subunit [Streptomonospora nanhaiensis]NYI97792.1 exodeoxyribonuclease VII large subunit [Streptomonospora nanhaiensis]